MEKSIYFSFYTRHWCEKYQIDTTLNLLDALIEPLCHLIRHVMVFPFFRKPPMFSRLCWWKNDELSIYFVHRLINVTFGGMCWNLFSVLNMKPFWKTRNLVSIKWSEIFPKKVINRTFVEIVVILSRIKVASNNNSHDVSDTLIQRFPISCLTLDFGPR